MINRDDIKEKLQAWLVDFVEKPNPLLGGWPPCPYARQARVGDKIEIRFSEPDILAFDVYKSLCKLDEGKEVIIICFDHTQIGAEFTQELVTALNRELMKTNYVILEDHPNAREYINGVQMNFGHCGLLLVSKLDMLNTASAQLKAKGYYDHWTQENLDEVVTWRFK